MKKTVHKNAILLTEFTKYFTDSDRKIIDEEKKYYQVACEIKKQRESLGLTQEKLAQLASIPRTTLTKVESGQRNVTIQMLMDLAQAMGKRIELKFY